VEVAIQWGRYAELLAYDNTTETIFREQPVMHASLLCE